MVLLQTEHNQYNSDSAYMPEILSRFHEHYFPHNFCFSSDTINERNRLLKDVFPDIQKYCQGKGLDFEVVDMRWGVRDNATADHLTSALCIKEIETCKRLSMGPHFVVSENMIWCTLTCGLNQSKNTITVGSHATNFTNS